MSSYYRVVVAGSYVIDSSPSGLSGIVNGVTWVESSRPCDPPPADALTVPVSYGRSDLYTSSILCDSDYILIDTMSFTNRSAPVNNRLFRVSMQFITRMACRCVFQFSGSFPPFKSAAQILCLLEPHMCDALLQKFDASTGLLINEVVIPTTSAGMGCAACFTPSSRTLTAVGFPGEFPLM